jgi:hypothetical protein
VEVRMHRLLAGSPKTLTVIKEASGSTVSQSVSAISSSCRLWKLSRS